MIVDFPKTAARRAAKRLASSKPRRSKNGTPEERAAKAVAAVVERVIVRRRSKNGTPDERGPKRRAQLCLSSRRTERCEQRPSCGVRPESVA
jgi:hypothetical protein